MPEGAPAPSFSVTLTPPSGPTAAATLTPQSATPEVGASHSSATAATVPQSASVSPARLDGLPGSHTKEDLALLSAIGAASNPTKSAADSSGGLQTAQTAPPAPVGRSGGVARRESSGTGLTQPNMAVAKPRRYSSGGEGAAAEVGMVPGGSGEGRDLTAQSGGVSEWPKGVGGEMGAERGSRGRRTRPGERPNEGQVPGGVCEDARIMFPGATLPAKLHHPWT